MGKRIISSAAVVLVLAVVALEAAGGVAGLGNAYHPALPTAQENAEIFVTPIEGISDDFIKGMDVSSVIAEEESGVRYYNEEGQEEDLFKLLADSGINYIRVRVWNKPYDAEGNGYGGGNCDVEKAVEIGRRAAEYGMKLLVDFHYSDFWADPNKQFCPVDWRDTEPVDKAQLLYDFTVESLKAIEAGGAEVGMVQIGNEINNGMSSEYSTEDIMTLLVAASRAVRSVSENIKIAVHYTEIDDMEQTLGHARALEDAQVDYDVFGVSYYPYWHGTMENLGEVLTTIQNDFGKETCVLETSYMFTTEDGDGFGNSVGEDNLVDGYPACVQGQANCVRDVMAAASEAGALGVFYWEGAWVPVGPDADTNRPYWEKYGSGWASSYAGTYDRMDAGQYYGGCSWDNQAFFDFEGKKLASLDVFKYVNYGAKSSLQIIDYPKVEVETALGEPLMMPLSVEAVWNDPTVTDSVGIMWDEGQVGAIDTSTTGEYTVDGTTADGAKLTAEVKVTNGNLLLNPSFEEDDLAMWNVEGNPQQTDIQDKAADALTGDKAFHFYSESPVGFDLSQRLTAPKTGNYTAVAHIQGGDMGSSEDIEFYVMVNGQETYSNDQVSLTGWQQWKTMELTDIPLEETDVVYVGVKVAGDAKGWGTIDDFEFYCQE